MSFLHWYETGFQMRVSSCFSLPPGRASPYLQGLQRRVSFLQCDETSLSLYLYLSLSSNEHLLFIWRWFFENLSGFRSHSSMVSLYLLVLQVVDLFCVSKWGLFLFLSTSWLGFPVPRGSSKKCVLLTMLWNFFISMSLSLFVLQCTFALSMELNLGESFLF